MKTIVAAGAALLLLAGACKQEDTNAGGLWGRTVEPHLTTTRSWHACTSNVPVGHVVADARCDTGPVFDGGCDEPVDSREQANQMLVSRPQCTDTAIAALVRLSRAEAAALSDLAGAYYIRAQRNDNPADLLHAFDAAQRAVAVRPQPAGAQFNRALILEALSLNAEAIDAWRQAAATEEGQWAEEARARGAELARRTALDGEHQWVQARAGLDAALDAHDAAGARRIVALFPATSEKYFEEEVLRQWAELPSPLQVGRVTTFAEALSQFFEDRYFKDVAAAIVNTRSQDVLRQGHLRFAEARAAENSPGAHAADLYDSAARLLHEAASPQYLLARIGYAVQNSVLTADFETALRQLETVAADAARYPSVITLIRLNRLYPDQFADHYDDFFAQYEALKKDYGRTGDWENRAALAKQVVPTMSVVGLKEEAWKEAFVGMRDSWHLPSLKTRYLLTGATAYAALGLDHPEAALDYQNLIIESARRAHANPFLVSILGHLAAIEIRLQRYDDARRHLDAANSLNEKGEVNVRVGLQARLAEVQAELALRVDPGHAVGLFTAAIALAYNTEYKTFLANLFARRADAFHRIGQEAKAANDRREALNQLHIEEERWLRERRPGLSDDVWNSYFARFEETYDLLIRQLIDGRQLNESFQYAERSRAFEPLDLVRKLPSAPSVFLELVAHPDNVDVDRLRAQLPPGTYVIEYRVFEDRAYAWIVGRDLFTGRWLPARRSDVKRWTEALQGAAEKKDPVAFERGLEPPYDGLLKAPLEEVRRAAGGTEANIVIIPDRALRGLPFAALRNPDTKRYVVEDHTLSMSGSALLYAFALLRDREMAAGDASALLIGDPAFDRTLTQAQRLSRLPGALEEARQVRALYPRSEALTGQEATPQRFLSLSGRSAIIDIAAHGIIISDLPSQSFLLFAPSGTENGVLTAASLMKGLQTAKTRLVVLGACSSAGGLPVGEEGIAPLVRPFVGAGVPGVIGALWDINDATATDLLVSFHGNYRQGLDAAAALRAAQLKMLRSSNPAERLGLSWAPFEAIGYASSPFASMENMKKEKPP